MPAKNATTESSGFTAEERAGCGLLTVAATAARGAAR
jgi:hypothetical protein